MDVLIYLLIIFNVSTVLGSTVRLPAAIKPEPCKLGIAYLNGVSVDIRISVLEGTNVKLVCSAMCSSEHYIPVLRWIDPQNKIVWDLPGKIFTASMSSHRRQILRIQDISSEDFGQYKCVGWIGYWTEVSINIEIDTGETEDIPKQNRKSDSRKAGHTLRKGRRGHSKKERKG